MRAPETSFFDTPASDDLPDGRAGAFARGAEVLAALATLVHLVFLGLFAWSGMTAMALANVGSVAVHAGSAVLARRRRTNAAALLMTGEICAHAMVAVWAMGWDSAFHIYVLLAIPLLVVNPAMRMPPKATLVTAVSAFYVGMDAALRNHVPHPALTPATLHGVHYFNVAAFITLLVLLAASYYVFITRSEAALMRLATTDTLTGLLNRRALLDRIAGAARRSRRQDRLTAVALLDVDHFKAINDTHGHEAGDAVLRAAAQALKAAVRDTDLLARWGGEEFLAVLPGADAATACRVAQRMLERLTALQVDTPAGAIAVTATVGIAGIAEGESFEQALARADAALYQGKQDGRDRVAVAPAPVRAPGHPERGP